MVDAAIGHKSLFRPKRDIIGLLKRLSMHAGMMSVHHAKAVVAWQCFDGGRRSLVNPERSLASCGAMSAL